MNFYKKMRNKTTLSPSEVVEKMKEVAPSLNANLDVKKYLQCEKGYRKMKGERLDSFLQVINNAKNNPVEQTLDKLNLEKWFEDFRINHYEEKMKEFGLSSQRQLANKLGITQPVVSTAINGYGASSETMQKIKKFFEDDMNIAVEETETPKSKKGGYNRIEKISDGEYEKLKRTFIEKAKATGKSYVELGKMLQMDNTTVGKIIRGAYKSKGKSVIEKMQKFINDEIIETTTETRNKPLGENCDYSKYANIIAEYKNENKLSLKYLANIMGISEGTMSQILNLKYSNMNPNMLEKLQRFCNEIKPIDEPIVEETITNNVEEVVEDTSEKSENSFEKAEENTVEETNEEVNEDSTEEKTTVYEFNITGTEEFSDMIKKYNKLLKKYDREHKILQNYETLINVIKNLQK